jgi:hypothetical protein
MVFSAGMVSDMGFMLVFSDFTGYQYGVMLWFLWSQYRSPHSV